MTNLTSAVIEIVIGGAVTIYGEGSNPVITQELTDETTTVLSNAGLKEELTKRAIANRLSNYPFTLDSARQYPVIAKAISDFVVTKNTNNIPGTLYIQQFRIQSGAANLMQVYAEGYTNSQGNGMVLMPSGTVNINGLTFVKLIEYANSGMEGYALIDTSTDMAYLAGLKMNFLPEVYNRNYPSIYRMSHLGDLEDTVNGIADDVNTHDSEIDILKDDVLKLQTNTGVANTFSNYPFTLDSAKQYPDVARSVSDLVITKNTNNITGQLSLKQFRIQDGSVNLFHVNADGYTNSVGNSLVMIPSGMTEINGLQFLKLSSYANSGMEGYAMVNTETAISRLIMNAPFVPEVYNINYPSKYTLSFLNNKVDKTEVISLTGKYRATKYKFNELSDILDKSRSITWVLGGAGTHTGKIDTSYQGADAVTIEKIDAIDGKPSRFGRGYKFKKDTPFLQYNAADGYKRIFQFNFANDIVGSSVVKSVVGFWIDRRELKGLPLQFTATNGGIWDISQANLLKVGYVAYQRGVGSKGYDQIEVTGIDGDFTHITIRDDKSNANAARLFNPIIENNSAGVNEITLWNPTLLYEEQYLDLYQIYLSESQHNASPIRGKTITIIGDSQQNDAVIALGISRRLGVNIIHAPMGGHRMKYQNNTSLGPYHGWMYHWNARKIVLSYKADYYFLMVSSNDSSGGGDLSTVATKRVLDNYPVYGDDEATVTAKLALFNALSESEKLTMFDYKQTYSAYIKQINTTYPEAKVVLATIPISSFQTTNNGEWIAPNTADTEREARQPIFISIRNDIFELSQKHNVNVCDLFLKSGITWENFPKKVTGIDAVHWTPEAKLLFVNPAVQSLIE